MVVILEADQVFMVAAEVLLWKPATVMEVVVLTIHDAKLNLASKKLIIKFWVVLAVLVFLLSLVAARGGAGGGYGGHSGGRSGRGAHGSTWGRGVLGAGSHRGGRGGHGSTWGRGVLGAGSHRGGNEASTPSGANAWLSWSLGFFAYVH
ncbi:hypothetical protein Q3G72_028235 [Acer saccharum]|nr:hypothetical protein Q3G72_028235 [Acer saccharum]